MIRPQDIRTWAFSYEEFEAKIKEYCPEDKIEYGAGGEIYVGDKLAQEVLPTIFPEFPENCICFYPEFGFIYTKRGADIIVIDGIQDEKKF